MSAQVVASPSRLSLLQQDRSRQTLRRLVDSAQQLWRTKGFDSTSVSEVCDAAGVSKGTFFYYFRRKEDLLVEMALMNAEQVWREAQENGSATPTRQRIHSIVRGIARRVSKTPRQLVARSVVELLGLAGAWPSIRGDRPDYHRTFAAVFSDAVKKGQVSRRFDPDELAAIFTVVMLQGMLFWARGTDSSLESVLWRRAEVLLTGVLSKS